MRKLVLMLALTTLTLTLPGAAASPGDPVHANDVIGLEGWKERTWAHFGNWRRGEVSAETWVDLHWPCFTATDEDQDCLLEDVRGPWSGPQALQGQAHPDRLRPPGPLSLRCPDRQRHQRELGHAPAHREPHRMGAGRAVLRRQLLPDLEPGHLRRPLVGRLPDQGLTLLSDPTEDYSTVICPTLDTPLEQRKAVRDRLLG
jgi:hypothetical protein